MSDLPELLSERCSSAERFLESGLLNEAEEVLRSLPPELQSHANVIALRMIIRLRSRRYAEAYELAKSLCLRQPGKIDLTQLVTRYRIFVDMMEQSTAWLDHASQAGAAPAMIHHLLERCQTARKNFDEARLALSQTLDTYL